MFSVWRVSLFESTVRKVIGAVEEVLQPNPALRTKVAFLGKGGGSAETDLGNVMLSGAAHLSESRFGRALGLVGDCELKLGEARETMAFEVQKGLILPLGDLQASELKELSVFTLL